jgi:hypothetical protein
MNFLKKYLLYLEFKKSIRKNKIILKSKFNIKIDRANRLYTVINISEEIFEEPYNLRSADIDNISQTYIKEYIRKLSEYFDSIGLSELYDFYEPIEKKGKYSYLIVLGFKPFNSVEFNKKIWFRLFPFLLFIIILFFLFTW